MSKRSDLLLVEDIVEAIEKIERYVLNMEWDTFQADERTCDAVVRNLEIIGEASNRLSPEFRQRNTSIDWFKIVGLRHRIVHGYFGVDLAIIWQIIQRDLPDLKSELQKI